MGSRRCPPLTPYYSSTLAPFPATVLCTSHTTAPYLPSSSLDRMPTASVRPSTSLFKKRGVTTCLCQMLCSGRWILQPAPPYYTEIQQHCGELQDETQCISSSSLTGEFKSKQGWRDAAAPASFRAGSTAHAQLLLCHAIYVINVSQLLE